MEGGGAVQSDRIATEKKDLLWHLALQSSYMMLLNQLHVSYLVDQNNQLTLLNSHGYLPTLCPNLT